MKIRATLEFEIDAVTEDQAREATIRHLRRMRDDALMWQLEAVETPDPDLIRRRAIRDANDRNLFEITNALDTLRTEIVS